MKGSDPLTCYSLYLSFRVVAIVHKLALFLCLVCSFAYRVQNILSSPSPSTIEGTTADENSMPPPDAIPIDEHNDKFNDFGALTGWTEEL